MSIYSAPGVEVEPRVKLSDWEIFRITYTYGKNKGKTEDRLAGNVDGTWRVSSAIKKREGNTVVTRSGREYTLIGASGFSGSVDSKLTPMVKLGGIQIVTKEYF